MIRLMSPLRPPEEERVFAPVLIVMYPDLDPDSASLMTPVLRTIAPVPSAEGLAEAPVLIVMLPLSPEREVPDVNVNAPPCWLAVVESVSPEVILTPPPAPLFEVPTARVIPPAFPQAAAPVARKMSPLVENFGVAAPVDSTIEPEDELSAPDVAPVAIVIPPVPGLSSSVLAVPIVTAPESPESESPVVS